MKKDLVGSVIGIPMKNEEYCYGRILKELDFVFYDYKTPVLDTDLINITSKDILFAALVTNRTLKDSNWQIIGKLPLDERHSITPIYYHPDLTNPLIADYTIGKIKETLKYKSFENKGLQDGGMHSGEHIEQRLIDYYEGRDDQQIINLIKMAEHLKEYHNKKRQEK